MHTTACADGVLMKEVGSVGDAAMFGFLMTSVYVGPFFWWGFKKYPGRTSCLAVLWLMFWFA